MNIVFFDASCPFCLRMVLFLQKKDRKERLYYAPLGGQTAKEYKVLGKESIAFVDEQKRIYRRSDALKQIFTIIERPVLRFLVSLPGSDFFYRIVAKTRRYFSMKPPTLKKDQNRFLP